MSPVLLRNASAALALLALAACSNPSAPPVATGGAPSTDVNPITGSRGGSSAGSSR